MIGDKWRTPTKTIWVASGTGVGVLVMDLILGNDSVEAIVKGMLAALIAAVLITVFERRS